MPLKICSLASSSRGNCIFIASEKTKLLIDAGHSFDATTSALNVLGLKNEDKISVLVTHTHRDHIGHLGSFFKYKNASIYSHYASGLDKVNKKVKVTFVDEEPFTVGDIQVTCFSLSHDTPCVGYTLECKDKKISVLTDFGVVTRSVYDNIKNSDIVFVESNHDEELVKKSRYPVHLKRRILSNAGHLSNKDCGTLCHYLVKNGITKTILLGHLSEENNTEELAYNTVCSEIEKSGAKEKQDFILEVAPRYKMSGLFEVK